MRRLNYEISSFLHNTEHKGLIERSAKEASNAQAKALEEINIAYSARTLEKEPCLRTIRWR